MNYLVMECHLSYAVVLDEEGQFRKVANLRYEVGQTVDRIIEMEEPLETAQPVKKNRPRWMASVTALAACLVLVVTSVFTIGQMPYGSVYLSINPEVRIDVDRKDRVIDLEGLNGDGETLIAAYTYQKKSLDLVTDELVDRAIEMGYLSAGGTVTLTLDGEDGQWVETTGDSLGRHLKDHLEETFSVTIQVNQTVYTGAAVTVPVGPTGDSGYGDSAYGSQPTTGDSGYKATPPATGTVTGDSGYQEPSQSNYGDSGYGAVTTTPSAGDSGYDSDDGNSSYEDDG